MILIEDMCVRQKILLNLASIDSIEIKPTQEGSREYNIALAIRSGGEKMKVFHTESILQPEGVFDSKEVLLYEPATGSKETLFDFVEREMLGKYEIQGRTGKIKYEV